MKQLFWIPLFTVLAGVFAFTACDDDEVDYGTSGVILGTPQIVELMDTVQLSVAYDLKDGLRYTSAGFCYGTEANPTIYDATVFGTVENGSISAVLTGLPQNPAYYIRAFVCVYNGETAYSEEVVLGEVVETPEEEEQPEGDTEQPTE